MCLRLYLANQGHQFADRITQFYKTFEAKDKLDAFAKTTEGENMIKVLKENTITRLPHLMDELKGLAEGSGISEDEVDRESFAYKLWNFYP